MQADNIKAGLIDLTRKLTNLDPIESHSAINQYFDTNAIVESKALSIKGAERIKKQLDLYNMAFIESEVVGDPKYNEEEQTIEFTVARLWQARVPFFVTYIPYAYRINQWYQYVHYNGVLHLNPDGSSAPEQGKATLLVTKMDLHQKEKPPLSNLIPYYLLRPFLSIVSNIIATVAAVVLSFPFTPKGLIWMTAALINNFWLWFYDKVAGTQEMLFPNAPSWATGPDSELPQLKSGAEYTLNYAARKLEERAKQVGIPVEQYKQKVKEVVQQVSDEGKKIAKEGQDKAVEVKDKAVEAKQKEKEEEVTTNDDTNDDAYDKSHKEDQRDNDTSRSGAPAEKTGTQGQDESKSDSPGSNQDLPQTPLGGTDPTAPNAPSYAAITVEDSATSEPAGKDETPGVIDKSKDDELPTTPLGGTDPTAPGAPSYADMTVETGRSVTPPGLSRGYSQPTSPGAPLRASREPTMTDDLPQTPLGGHDPTALGAISYAAAAHE